jgi:ADP-ribosyl-[dinitrogen reductase] hydrolase
VSPFNVHLPDVRDRARAALLGLAVGDALGATLEFMTPSEIRAQYGTLREITGGGWLHLRRGEVTDDTQMALCLARAIAERGTFDARAVAERFAAWLRSSPPDVGNTCRRGIRRFIVDGTLEAPFRTGDAGNGAAMRVAPISLLSMAVPAQLEQLSLAQARITHNHPLSDAATVLVARLVQLGCLGVSLHGLRRAADAVVAQLPNFRFESYHGLSTAYVVDTITTVLHFFFATRSFEECLVAIVNQGGDADTTGAIAGAIAGAYYGPEEIPARWLKRLDPALVKELGTLSDQLLDLSPLVQGVPPTVT